MLPQILLLTMIFSLIMDLRMMISTKSSIEAIQHGTENREQSKNQLKQLPNPVVHPYNEVVQNIASLWDQTHWFVLYAQVLSVEVCVYNHLFERVDFKLIPVDHRKTLELWFFQPTELSLQSLHLLLFRRLFLNLQFPLLFDFIGYFWVYDWIELKVICRDSEESEMF